MNASPLAAADRPPESGDVTHPTVLVVEDDPILSDILARNLEARDYHVVCVATASEAIEALCHDLPAVMLVDIDLPDRSGWDVMRELRAQGCHVPTVVMTAVRCSQARLAEFQPEAYLPKPFPLPALLDAVGRLARREAPAARRWLTASGPDEEWQ